MTESSIRSLADAFEKEWSAGERPSVKAYLEKCDPAELSEGLELLIPIDVRYLLSSSPVSSEKVSAEQYSGYGKQAVEIARQAILQSSVVDGSHERVEEKGSFEDQTPATTNDVTLSPVGFADTPTILPTSQPSGFANVPTNENLTGEERLLSYKNANEFRKWRYGRILDATHPRLRRSVRIVVLDGPYHSDAKIREAFLEQARAAGLVDHPNVETRVWEAVEDGDTVFVVLEPNANLPLKQFFPRTKSQKLLVWLYPNEELVNALLQSLEGISAIHGNGLHHGAIKASSVRWNAKSERAVIGELVSLDKDIDRTNTDPVKVQENRERDLQDLGLAFAEMATGVPADEWSSQSLPLQVGQKLHEANGELSPRVRTLLSRIVTGDQANGDAKLSPARLARELRDISSVKVESVSRRERMRTLVYDLPILLFVFAGIGGMAAGENISNELMLSWISIGGPLAVIGYVTVTEVLFGFTLGRAVRKVFLISRAGVKATYSQRLMRNVYRWGLMGAIALFVESIGRLLLLADANGATESEVIDVVSGSRIFGAILAVLIVYGSGFFNRLGKPFHEIWSNTTWGRNVKPSKTYIPSKKLTSPGLAGSFASSSTLGVGSSSEARTLKHSIAGSTKRDDIADVTDRVCDSTDVFKHDLAETIQPTGLSSIATSLLAKGDPFGQSCETRVDQYEVVGELGRGGMGTVLAAKDTTLQRKVAIKMISPELASGTEAIKRFEQESQLAARLSHENIGRVFGVGLHSGSPYLVMEYVDGESLKEAVERLGALSKSDAWDAILQAATGLEEAQKSGIIHRDIKPANLMVDRAGVIKVMDFGLSKLIADERKDEPLESAEDRIADHPEMLELTMAGATMGTPMYMSPEQANAGRVDARSDIYSLGLTLYFLLTGKTPFQSGDVFELISMQVAEMPESVRLSAPTLSSAQVTVLERMIAKNPDDRYPDYQTLIDDLRASAPRELELASAGLRSRAIVLTSLIAAAPSIIYGILDALISSQYLISDSGIIFQLAILISHVLGIWFYGQTPGKWLVGIRVIRIDEMPIRFWHSVFRYITYPPFLLAQIAFLFSLQQLATTVLAIAWFVSFIMITFSKSKRGIHDYSAGTLVAKVPPDTKIKSKRMLSQKTKEMTQR